MYNVLTLPLHVRCFIKGDTLIFGGSVSSSKYNNLCQGIKILLIAGLEKDKVLEDPVALLVITHQI